MPEFARLGEKAIFRWDELTNEEMKFYAIVLLHSLPNEAGVRILTLTDEFGLEAICNLHGLNYDNTMRRFARMRTGILEGKHQPKKVTPMQSPWLKWDRKRNLIYPLVGVKVLPEGADVFETKKTVKTTAEITVNITENDEEKTVKTTVSDCKNYSENADSTVKTTAPIIRNTESTEVNQKTHTEEKSGVRDKKSEGNSIFTLEQCLQYAKAQKDVRIPKALALTLHRTGEADEFIKKFLFPEPAADEQRMQKELENLVEALALGDEMKNYRKFYSEDEWQWLMNQLEQITN